jgi:phosphopantothenoylcysteine synthetase/decarboxylase
MLTVRELRRIIDASGLPDDAEVYVGDALTGLADARPEYLVRGSGMVITCKDEQDAAKALDRQLQRDEWFDGAVSRGLILLTEDDLDTYDDEYDDMDDEEEDRDEREADDDMADACPRPPYGPID